MTETICNMHIYINPASVYRSEIFPDLLNMSKAFNDQLRHSKQLSFGDFAHFDKAMRKWLNDGV